MKILQRRPAGGRVHEGGPHPGGRRRGRGGRCCQEGKVPRLLDDHHKVVLSLFTTFPPPPGNFEIIYFSFENITIPSVSTSLSYTTTFTVASLTCTPNSFKLSKCWFVTTLSQIHRSGHQIVLHPPDSFKLSKCWLCLFVNLKFYFIFNLIQRKCAAVH